MCKIDKVLILRISLFLYPLIFLISCNVKKTKEALDTDHNPIVLETKEYVVPPSDILNLKSYYLSAVYQKDSAALLYGYNYKSHALDVFDLSTLQTGQLSFFKEGPSGVQRPIYGFFVCSPDSVRLLDEALSFLLINKSGEVLKRIQSQQLLKSDETALVAQNYAIATDKFYYDAAHGSLLFGVMNRSDSNRRFKVYEISVDNSTLLTEYVLQPSVEGGDVYNSGYGNMNKPNICFTDKYILYNYPIESHIYIMDRDTKTTQALKADSRFTGNVADKCSSESDYNQWVRHGIENPHFYEIMYVHSKHMYARLHTGGRSFDVGKSISDLYYDKKLYLTVFNDDFSVYDEIELPSYRYNLSTAWSVLENGLLLYVDNPLSNETKDENLRFDIIKWSNGK